MTLQKHCDGSMSIVCRHVRTFEDGNRVFLGGRRQLDSNLFGYLEVGMGDMCDFTITPGRGIGTSIKIDVTLVPFLPGPHRTIWQQDRVHGAGLDEGVSG